MGITATKDYLSDLCLKSRITESIIKFDLLKICWFFFSYLDNADIIYADTIYKSGERERRKECYYR